MTIRPMGTLFKAWLIDPAARSISAVQTAGTLDSVYQLLQCSTVDVIVFDEMHVLWVDDQGLLVDHDEQRFFVLNAPRRLHLIGGRALVAASPERDATASEGQLRARAAASPGRATLSGHAGGARPGGCPAARLTTTHLYPFTRTVVATSHGPDAAQTLTAERTEDPCVASRAGRQAPLAAARRCDAIF